MTEDTPVYRSQTDKLTNIERAMVYTYRVRNFEEAIDESRERFDKAVRDKLHFTPQTGPKMGSDTRSPQELSQLQDDVIKLAEALMDEITEIPVPNMPK